jgi:hypothetical protein
MDERQYEKDWPGLPVKYLIIASKKYIVFLDNDNDLDWQTTDSFDDRELTPEQKIGYNEVKNEIDSAECIPADNLDDKIVVSFKKQLGEALVRAFESDFENAKKMVLHAKEFILKRSIEQSRFMFLTSCGVTTLFSLILFIVLWISKEFAIDVLGETVYYSALSCLIGGLGALLSVILRMGKSNLDFNASRKLHYLEGSSRVIAGMISALIIAICVKTGILLPIFSKIDSTHLAMILSGIVAGTSERFAPSIINQLEKQINTNQ